MEPKPGRKWEVVDASYYGRGGAGGIRPVTVSGPHVYSILVPRPRALKRGKGLVTIEQFLDTPSLSFQ